MTYRASGLIDAVIAEGKGAGKHHESVMRAIEEYALEASMMKVAGSEYLFQIIDEMLQIHGGNGFAEDYPIERAYRDNRVNRISPGQLRDQRRSIPRTFFSGDEGRAAAARRGQ